VPTAVKWRASSATWLSGRHGKSASVSGRAGGPWRCFGPGSSWQAGSPPPLIVFRTATAGVGLVKTSLAACWTNLGGADGPTGFAGIAFPRIVASIPFGPGLAVPGAPPVDGAWSTYAPVLRPPFFFESRHPHPRSPLPAAAGRENFSGHPLPLPLAQPRGRWPGRGGQLSRASPPSMTAVESERRPRQRAERVVPEGPPSPPSGRTASAIQCGCGACAKHAAFQDRAIRSPRSRARNILCRGCRAAPLFQFAPNMAARARVPAARPPARPPLVRSRPGPRPGSLRIRGAHPHRDWTILPLPSPESR